MKLFPDACQAVLHGKYKQYLALSEALALMLQGNGVDDAGCLGLGQAPGSSSPTLQAVRLVLLLWLTRATLGVIKCCLRNATAEHSSSRGGGSSSASGGGADEPAETSSSSTTRIAGVDMVQKGMVTLTAPLLQALVKWQKTTFQLTTRGSNATSLPAAAGAGAGTDVSCLTTGKRLSRLPLQGLPEAVTAQLDKCSTIWRQVLPRSASGDVDNLLELPPLPVLEDIIANGIEGLEELGREMVVLFEVLLEEVPSPLGCNFPGCSNLSGFTEADEAGSVCTRCHEARYCSRQCQVDHWEQHKRACRRLRKQAEAAAAAGGRTVEVEGAGRTGGGGGVGKVTKASRKGVAKG